MRVTRIYNIQKSNVRCFFDLEIIEGAVIKGFKLVSGSKGDFISGPSYKKEDGEYQNIAWIREPASSNILETIKALYDKNREGAYNVVNMDKGRATYLNEVGTKNETKPEDAFGDLPF
tara:strand:- start:7148 stop:7501 length:354 start_codon:yes stop_codon:yes gene_type:complete